MGSPPAPGFNVELERSIIRFAQSDKLKISFGRYHTPINYWNTQYHHGSWLQTSESRPEMIQFGGRFLPVHFIVALAEGALPAGGEKFYYQLLVLKVRRAPSHPRRNFRSINKNRTSPAHP